LAAICFLEPTGNQASSGLRTVNSGKAAASKKQAGRAENMTYDAGVSFAVRQAGGLAAYSARSRRFCSLFAIERGRCKLSC